jgi:hypothetical protein
VGVVIDTEKKRVTFIVNGEDTVLELEAPAWPIRVLRKWALEKSLNLGRPAVEWEVRQPDGVLVDPDRSLDEFDKRGRFFLSLMVGAGGCGVAA